MKNLTKNEKFEMALDFAKIYEVCEDYEICMKKVGNLRRGVITALGILF